MTVTYLIITIGISINNLQNYKHNMLHKYKFIEELNNTYWDFITNYAGVNGTYNTCIDFILISLAKQCPYESKRILIKKQ